MVSSYYYNGNIYKERSDTDRMKGFVLASLADTAILGTLPAFGKPLQNQLLIEEQKNTLYKKHLYDSLEISGLKEKGVRIAEAQEDLKKGILNAESLGKNAYYDSKNNIIKLNTDKISAAGFHELGHAMNNLKSISGKFLQKYRGAGYAIAGLMGYFAMFSRHKPKDAPKSNFDFIEDNCGKIAFTALLPVVAEEALASYKGIKLAKQSGMNQMFRNNLKKLYSKALLTYGARAVLGGFAVGTSRMIMDYYTRPKILDSPELFF